MSEDQSEQSSKPISPEDQATLDGAFPMLQKLHTDEQVIDGTLPDDYVVFPGKYVELKPYYMNRGDPSETGLWKINVDGTTYARISTVPDSSSGIHYEIKVVSQDAGNRDATPDETHQISTLLGAMNASFTSPTEIKE